MQDDRHAEWQYLPENEPEWWQPYVAEFPYWHAWTGIAGMLYARRLLSSPARVVRVPGPDPEALREAIIASDMAMELARKEGVLGPQQLAAIYGRS